MGTPREIGLLRAVGLLCGLLLPMSASAYSDCWVVPVSDSTEPLDIGLPEDGADEVPPNVDLWWAGERGVLEGSEVFLRWGDEDELVELSPAEPTRVAARSAGLPLGEDWLNQFSSVGDLVPGRTYEWGVVRDVVGSFRVGLEPDVEPPEAPLFLSARIVRLGERAPCPEPDVLPLAEIELGLADDVAFVFAVASRADAETTPVSVLPGVVQNLSAGPVLQMHPGDDSCRFETCDREGKTAGYYQFAAVDLAGNISEFSEPVLVEDNVYESGCAVAGVRIRGLDAALSILLVLGGLAGSRRR